jgi:hypothetical protein
MSACERTSNTVSVSRRSSPTAAWTPPRRDEAEEEEKEEAGSRRGRRELGAGFARNPIADCGLRIADCGLKITAGRSPHEEFFAAGEEMYG